MATQLSYAELSAAFTKWRLPDVKWLSGASTRGNGTIANMSGIIIHHTGADHQSDSYVNFLFIDGRPDVPPPLCNFATRMNGQLIVGALEQANHAGMGSSASLSKARTGDYDWRNREIVPGADNFNGNDYYYGNEVMFDGGQPITAAAWKTIVLSCAAICDAYGWGAWHVIGHKEHSGRKWDPGKTLMYLIRRDVAAALAAGPGWPNAQEEIDMATVAELVSLMNQTLNAVKALQVDFNNFEALYAGRWSQDINEGRSHAAAAQARFDALVEWLTNEETEEDFIDKLNSDRWAQGIEETRNGFAEAQAVMTKILASNQEPTPTDPPPASLPKA